MGIVLRPTGPMKPRYDSNICPILMRSSKFAVTYGYSTDHTMHNCFVQLKSL
jgi:hypothetical protein